MAMKDKMTVAEISEFFGVSETAVRDWEKKKNGIKRIEGETPIAFKTDDVFNYTQEEQIIPPNVLTRKSPKSASYKATIKIDESCPLCGKYDPVIDLGDDSLFRVVCQSCHHQGVGMPSADEAIREWNRSARYYRNVSIGKMEEKKEIRKELLEEKEAIIKDLAKLETIDWADDPKIAESIFPYVLIEAINLLKNSVIIENPIDYTSTGKNAQKMLDEILS